jgi:hypothetical protein
MPFEAGTCVCLTNPTVALHRYMTCSSQVEAALTSINNIVLELAVVICDDVSLAALDSDDLAMLACMPITTHFIRG